ncbi:MAG: GNAT family protein [Planctomycetota bacterium]|nr:GNAT family protein [Planctomycetota bacterium]
MPAHPQPRRPDRPHPLDRPRPDAQAGRVSLRSPCPADKQEFLLLRARSRDFLAPWEATPPGVRNPFTEAAFDRFLSTASTDTSRRWLIVRNQDGAILGQIGLGGIIRGAFQSAFVGYWLGSDYARQGYMSEALALALKLAFGPLKLHRVEANIIPGNEPSRALVKKLGFRYEGLALRYLRVNHRWQDHEHWAITSEDCKQRRPAAN